MSTRQTSGRDPMDNISIHVNDWIASETVQLLGLTGESIYLRLLMAQWKGEQDGLPAEPDLLRRLTTASPKEWKAAWSLLEKHFPVDPIDGKRRNARLLNEWQFLHDRRVKNRQIGSLGGQQTARKWSSGATPIATPIATANAQAIATPPSPSPTPELPVHPRSSSTGDSQSTTHTPNLLLHKTPRGHA